MAGLPLKMPMGKQQRSGSTLARAACRSQLPGQLAEGLAQRLSAKHLAAVEGQHPAVVQAVHNLQGGTGVAGSVRSAVHSMDTGLFVAQAVAALHKASHCREAGSAQAQ